MKVVSVVGPQDAGRTTLVERLVERLADRGRVGTVTHLDGTDDPATGGTGVTRHRDAGATQTYSITESGWVVTGADTVLGDALDSLAVSCSYAIVEGDGQSDLPTVSLGEARVEDPLLAAPTAKNLALDEVVSAVESVEEYETLTSLVDQVKRSSDSDKAGAIATFTGRVRERDHPNDEPTEYLEFERYDEVATERMATIRDDLESRDGVYAVRLHHRTGVVDAGEDIVFVVVLAGHRAEAFETVEDGIDRLKAEVPLFKKEVTVSETFWSHQE